MNGKTYLFEVVRVKPCPCQAATIRSYRAANIERPAVPCKRTARVSLGGLTLCPVHAGIFIAYGALPAASGGVYEIEGEST